MVIGIAQRIQHNKQPFEVLPIDVNFGKLSDLPRGASEIVTATATAKKWKRTQSEPKTDAPEILESPNPTILPPYKTKVRLVIQGGEDNYDYQVTVRVTFDNGAKLEEEIFVRVREE